MKTSWLNNKRPDELIKAIKPNVNVSPDGRLNILLKEEVEFLIFALYDNIKHPFKLDQSSLYSIFEETILKHIAENELSNADKGLRLFNDQCSRICNIQNKYTFIATISLNKKYKLKRRRLKGCTVSFNQEIPKKYRSQRKEFIEEFQRERNDTIQENDEFMNVCISLESSSKKTALELALDTLDIIRFIWQVIVIKRINIIARRDKDKYRTDSVISIGPILTIHSQDVQDNACGIWYFPDYLDKGPVNLTNIESAELNFENILAKFKNSPFRNEIEDILIKYISALDWNHELRFMKLWAVLEQLLDSHNSDHLTRRISFFFRGEERIIQRRIFESLRFSRHKNVHVGTEPVNIEAKCFKLCRYIELVLIFYILNDYGVRSFKEMIELISTNFELKEIERKIKILEVAKKVLEADLT